MACGCGTKTYGCTDGRPRGNLGGLIDRRIDRCVDAAVRARTRAWHARTRFHAHTDAQVQQLEVEGVSNAASLKLGAASVMPLSDVPWRGSNGKFYKAQSF